MLDNKLLFSMCSFQISHPPFFPFFSRIFKQFLFSYRRLLVFLSVCWSFCLFIRWFVRDIWVNKIVFPPLHNRTRLDVVLPSACCHFHRFPLPFFILFSLFIIIETLSPCSSSSSSSFSFSISLNFCIFSSSSSFLSVFFFNLFHFLIPL